jgi:hypothetical protein
MMLQVTSMNKQLEKLSRGSLRFIRLALLGLLFVGSQSHSQEAGVFEGGEVPLADLPGKRIDRDWFRYTNTRFGLAIDIPARGYRYVLPANGSGMAVISGDEKIWITIYAHFVVNHLVFIADPDDPDLRNAAAAIRRIYDHEVAETLATGSTITYSVKKKNFYVLAGHFADTTYYERMTISPRCPHVFNSLRITYRKSKERELSKFVTRLSRSLRATCQGEDSFPDNIN